MALGSALFVVKKVSLLGTYYLLYNFLLIRDKFLLLDQTLNGNFFVIPLPFGTFVATYLTGNVKLMKQERYNCQGCTESVLRIWIQLDSYIISSTGFGSGSVY